MKKSLSLLLALVMLFAMCAGQAAYADEADAATHFEKLDLGFVPSVDAETILSATTYLPELLKLEMAKRGFTVDEISISVGESYEATGEALASGEYDAAWIPAGTYAAYMDDTAVMLEATRQGLSNDSTDPADWNGIDNKTEAIVREVGFYYGLIYAGPSEYGRMLAEKANKGEAITWEELEEATWAVQKTTSSAGYIYPSMWLMDNYEGRRISDLSNVIPLNGYRQAFELAAQGKVDIILAFSDARMDYEELWNIPSELNDTNNIPGMGREGSIWDEMQVIGITDPIRNDTVSISKASEFFTPEAAKALQESLMEIISTDAGKAFFSFYNHTGYIPGNFADYVPARNALNVVTHASEADIFDLPDSEEGDGETIAVEDLMG